MARACPGQRHRNGRRSPRGHLHVRRGNGLQRGNERLLDLHQVAARGQKPDLVVPGLITASRRLEVVPDAVRVQEDLGVRDRTGRPPGVLRYRPGDRADCGGIDRSQDRVEIERVVVAGKVVQKAPTDVEIEHDVRPLGRYVDRVLDRRVDRRPAVPVHVSRGLRRIVPGDRGQARVDGHADPVVPARGHLPLAQERRRPLLQGEQVEALAGLGDDRPQVAATAVLRCAGLDPHDVDGDAVERVIREGSVGEPHRDARPQPRRGGDRGVVLVAPGQGERDRQESGECGTSRH